MKAEIYRKTADSLNTVGDKITNQLVFERYVKVLKTKDYITLFTLFLGVPWAQ